LETQPVEPCGSVIYIFDCFAQPDDLLIDLFVDSIGFASSWKRGDPLLLRQVVAIRVRTAQCRLYWNMATKHRARRDGNRRPGPIVLARAPRGQNHTGKSDAPLGSARVPHFSKRAQQRNDAIARAPRPL
jgi:hypothetical protein